MAQLISVHILSFADGSRPASTSPSPVYGLPFSAITAPGVTAASTKDIQNFPTAASRIYVSYRDGNGSNEVITGSILVTEAVAAIIAAS